MSSDEPADDEEEVFITKSVTLIEYIDSTGRRQFDWTLDGEPERWDVLGLLAEAMERVKNDWYEYVEEDTE